MIFMTVVVWRGRQYVMHRPAKRDHKGAPRKGAGKTRGNISKFYSKLPFTMVGGACNKPRGHKQNELFLFSKSQISVSLTCIDSRPAPAIVLVVWI